MQRTQGNTENALRAATLFRLWDLNSIRNTTTHSPSTNHRSKKHNLTMRSMCMSHKISQTALNLSEEFTQRPVWPRGAGITSAVYYMGPLVQEKTCFTKKVAPLLFIADGCWFVGCWGLLWIRFCESGGRFWKPCFALQLTYQYSAWPQISPLVCLVLIQPRPWARQVVRCNEEDHEKSA